MGEHLSSGLHMLGIGCFFLIELIFMGGVDCWAHHSEDLLFGPGLLIAGSPSFFDVGFVLFEEVPECNFELLVKDFLLLLDGG